MPNIKTKRVPMPEQDSEVKPVLLKILSSTMNAFGVVAVTLVTMVLANQLKMEKKISEVVTSITYIEKNIDKMCSDHLMERVTKLEARFDSHEQVHK